jgi:hypothetical protein
MMRTTFRDPADDDLPKRTPGAAKNELDPFASLAGIPPMAVRPADPRRPWRDGEQILLAADADALHQAVRAILAENRGPTNHQTKYQGLTSL